jgi:hypothetical protein
MAARLCRNTLADSSSPVMHLSAAVRTAYVIGMPEWIPPQADAIEVEIRTRTWACCFTLDK